PALVGATCARACAATRALWAARGRFRTAGGLGGLVHAGPQATGHEPFVPGPQRSIADGGHDGGRSAHRPDAPLHGREVEAGDRLRDRELEERSAALDEVADGRVPLLGPQVRRVAASRLDRDERLRDEALLQLERLERGTLARFVAVEGE